MEKVTVEIGAKIGKRRTVKFTGEELTSRTVLHDPGHDSRGTKQELYLLPDGKYRVFEKNWSHWQGEESDNYSSLSDPLTRDELIESYGGLASDANIQEEIDLDENPQALNNEE